MAVYLFFTIFLIYKNITQFEDKAIPLIKDLKSKLKLVFTLNYTSLSIKCCHGKYTEYFDKF